jgi:hypothetical protein
VRFKPVPRPPESLSAVAAAQRAVPLVPHVEDDCCGRLLRRRDLQDRDAARTWLAFLRALDLVEETDDGYRRLGTDPTPERLREGFRERVFGAREAIDVLSAADRPLDGETVFERMRDRIPTWERHRNPDWERRWRDRVESILAWLVLLELADRVDGGYRLAEDLA